MGTRGVYGFRKNGKSIAFYRHYDSYPEGLGYDMVQFLKDNRKTDMAKVFDSIVEIDPETKPTEEQIQYCKSIGWFDGDVSSRSVTDWYCLLHETQYPKNMQKAIDAEGTIYVENYIDFLIHDSLFCEYGYIYDIDKKELEFYDGFQHVPQEGNPYGMDKNDDGYYPCRLIGKIDAETLDESSTDEIVGYMSVKIRQYEKEM